ncbi:MAG: twin-arginine translocation signal domain-containing protein, partial [Opitutaceae bacterium]
MIDRRRFLTNSLAATAAAAFAPQLSFAAGPTAGPVRVSRRDPRYLETADGRPFVPIGLNLCFPRFVDTGAAGLALYERWLTRLAVNGGNFFRLFLGHQFFDPEVEAAGRFD